MTPLIIPVFLPYLGCREHCIFCNQRASVEEIQSPASVRNSIRSSLIRLPADKKERQKQVAFYGGSFTAIPQEDQIRYLEEIKPFLDSGQIDSIRISTRPDALDEEILPLLKAYGVKTVEIGAQSMVDQILSLSERGHHSEDTVSATIRLKRWGFEVGIHLMMGLPCDTFDRFFQSIERVIELHPDFVRIHPTLVLKGASLEEIWKAGGYSPLSLHEAIQWLRRGLLRLERSSIKVARIGLQPTKQLERDFLAGPFHPALHQLVDSEIAFDMAAHLLQILPNGSQCLFLCHPKEISNLRGQKNENILKLKNQFQLKDIFIQGREEVPRGSLILQTHSGEVSVSRKNF